MNHFFSQAGKRRERLLAFSLLFFATFSFANEVDFIVSASKTEIRQGEEFTYSVSVYNRNETHLENVLVADSMPRGVTLVSCNAEDYTLSNRSMFVKIPLIHPGEERSFDVTVRVDRRGSIVKELQLQENGATIKAANHTINVLSNKVLTESVSTFTPNGDGENDYFEIPGLLSYPDNELVVFNRYSDRVYHKRGYANDWNGGALPEGIYYYLLTVYVDSSVVQKYNGFVTLKR
ncbi:MAG: gliding motility-associated C-terminal domain-containing protein [Prevotellaceae bacterium]|jgi:gliding motility-associated-like protein/uncharacterized repeat protein (TIGR01451 family)|nr:gliding motility-associated C-terminal domain-containing protein [Prevotellaceae bacterium]